MGFYSIAIVIVIILTVVFLIIDRLVSRTQIPTSNDAATKALDRISNWTTWISGLQTAAIASVGFLYTNRTPSNLMLNYAFFTLLFFGTSILIATWLLCSLPSMQIRLKNEITADNDIYEMKIFQFNPFRFGGFATLVHIYFIIGIVFFTLFIYAAINSPILPKPH